MTMRIVSIIVVLAALVIFPTLAQANQAADAFSQGSALLTKGDFQGALKAYATAAKADSANPVYRQQYSVLRQVIKMRKRIATEKNPKKWESSAKALRAFYYKHGVYSEALTLDQQSHARVNTPLSATLLAETMLELGMDTEATELLSNLKEDKLPQRPKVLLGIALARQGKIDEAKNVTKDFAMPEKAGAIVFWDLARLHALFGDTSKAMGLLTSCFESTTPSQLDAVKADAKESRDFRNLVAMADFAKVLKTESKVKESSCSSGSSCGTCPHRSSCGSGSSSSTKKP